MEALDEADREMREARKPDSGRLRVNAPLSLGVRLLPGVVGAFREAYPHIDLDIHLTDAFVDVMDTDCDLAIRISQAPTDVSTIWRKLCVVPRIAVASPAKRGTSSPEIGK